MSKTMKAAVVHEFGKPLKIEEVPVPTPNDDQILVKIEASGVCHTDLHAADGDWPVKPNPPFIPGHEGAGVVVQAGRNVKHVKEGDRVGLPWLYSACGYCVHCLGGRGFVGILSGLLCGQGGRLLFEAGKFFARGHFGVNHVFLQNLGFGSRRTLGFWLAR